MKKLLITILLFGMPLLSSAQVVFKQNQLISSTTPSFGVLVGIGVGTSTIRASSTPVVASLNATSTAATSTFSGGISGAFANLSSGLIVTGNISASDLYAFGNDINLGNGTATSTISGGFGIGVGTTTPGAAFAVATGTTALNTAFLLSNLGTGYTFWAEDAANDASPFVIDGSGNVGIGTAAPSYTFHISKAGGNAAVQNTTASGAATLDFINPTATWQIGTDNGGNGTGNNQWFVYNGGYRLTIQNGTGNVGIGITTPSKLLSVSGDASVSDLYALGNDINLGNGTATSTISGGFGIGVGTTTPGAAFAVATGTTALNTAFLLSNLGAGYTFWAEDAANDTTPFVIDSGGNVGIGAASPQAPLHVGPTTTEIPAAGTQGGNIAIERSDNALGLFMGMNSAGNGWFQAQRTDSVNYNSILINPNGGNVGIASSTPAAKLSVEQGAAGTLGFYLAGYANATADVFRISTSTASVTSTALFIDKDGRLGIATSSFSSQLSVSIGTAGNASSTSINIGSTAKPSCLTLYSIPSGNPFAVYVSDAGTLTTSAGGCRTN